VVTLGLEELGALLVSLRSATQGQGGMSSSTACFACSSITWCIQTSLTPRLLTYEGSHMPQFVGPSAGSPYRAASIP
jgi:hypothetical protein